MPSVLIVPYWPSASFWSLIIDGEGFISDVVAHVELPVNKEYYVAGRNSALFGKIDLPFKMYALRLDCRYH